MDAATIAGAWEGLKTAKQLFAAFIDGKVDEAARPKIHAAVEQVGKAQDTLYELRDELFKLQATNEELRRELAAIDEWKQLSARYALGKTEGGAVVYVYNAEPVRHALTGHLLTSMLKAFGFAQCASFRGCHLVQ